MAVCAALDAMKWNEIVGSIAGDDTIMCAVRSVDDTVKVMDKIKNFSYRRMHVTIFACEKSGFDR